MLKVSSNFLTYTTFKVKHVSRYRINPHTTHTFKHRSTNVKQGVRVINGYKNQNFITSMPRERVRVEQG